MDLRVLSIVIMAVNGIIVVVALVKLAYILLQEKKEREHDKR